MIVRLRYMWVRNKSVFDNAACVLMDGNLSESTLTAACKVCTLHTVGVVVQTGG